MTAKTKSPSKRRRLLALERGWRDLADATKEAIRHEPDAPPGSPDPIATAYAQAMNGLRLVRHAISQTPEE